MWEERDTKEGGEPEPERLEPRWLQNRLHRHKALGRNALIPTPMDSASRLSHQSCHSKHEGTPKSQQTECSNRWICLCSPKTIQTTRPSNISIKHRARDPNSKEGMQEDGLTSRLRQFYMNILSFLQNCKQIDPLINWLYELAVV